MDLRKWALALVGWIAGLATVGLAGLAIVFGGLYDTTATTPHLPIVAWAVHTTFINSVKLRASPIEPPRHVSREQILAGLADYDRSCTGCHGGPAVSRSPFAAAMLPTPPFLLDAQRKWTPAELYWIVHEGVKMTPMPAWGESRTDAQVWNMVAFLEAMPQISPADYLKLRQAAEAGGPPSAEAAAARARVPAMLELPKTPAFPPWLNLLAMASIACGLVCSALIVADLFWRPQRMWIMNLVWPLTALFGGLLWLGGYLIWGRAPPRGSDAKSEKPFAASVAIGASHCGAGCALGDLVAEWLLFAVPVIALAFGWKSLFGEKTFAVWVVDYLVAFVFGVAFQYFTIKPMRDLSVAGGVWQALKADAASITSWQVGMYGLMAILQFAVFQPLYGKIAPVDSFVFWFAMQLAMLAGFCTAYPVNWWLIRSGVKESM